MLTTLGGLPWAASVLCSAPRGRQQQRWKAINRNHPVPSLQAQATSASRLAPWAFVSSPQAFMATSHFSHPWHGMRQSVALKRHRWETIYDLYDLYDLYELSGLSLMSCFFHHI